MIHFVIILPSTFRSYQWYSRQVFRQKICKHFLSLKCRDRPSIFLDLVFVIISAEEDKSTKLFCCSFVLLLTFTYTFHEFVLVDSQSM
jgi:hypothetical protein